MEPVELLVSEEVDEKNLIARDVRVIIDSSHPGTKGGGFLHFGVMTLPSPVCSEVLEVQRAEVVEVNNQSLKSDHRNTGWSGLRMKVSCEEGYEFTDDPNTVEAEEIEETETPETPETLETSGAWSAWAPSACSSPCVPGSRASHRTCSLPGACRGDHTRQEGCIGTCSFFPEGRPIVKDDLLTVLPRIGKEWRISHDIFPTSFPGGDGNTIHFFASATGAKDNKDVVGSRIPMFVFNQKQNALKVFYPINGKVISGKWTSEENRYSLPALNQWTSYDMSQRFEDPSYIFRIVINGKQVLEVENQEPQEFSDVKIYVSSPWKNRVEGLIRNLFVEGLQQGNTYQ